MTIAGHALFETTRRFYFAVRNHLLYSPRKASVAELKSTSVAKLLQVPTEAQDEIALQPTTDLQSSAYKEVGIRFVLTPPGSSTRRANLVRSEGGFDRR